ncbi:MAG: phosphoserine phosphatase SerB, partial [Bdellovibrionales bacterium]|nr:phosphoserine phosphatase SerB [Bdellovibrionales bacterium]
MTTEYVLVKVSGPDHPGITSNLMNIIVNGHQKIIDMGQSVTHGFLSLSILLELDSSQHESPVLKELLFEAKKMGLTLDFDLVDMNIAYSSSIDEKFVLNCV